MTDTPTTDTGTTDASSTDDTRSEASRATIETLLERVRALRDRRITPATEPGSPPVLLADGGQSDAKVIGHNMDASGQTVGVWGEVDSPDGCGLATPDDARIDGTTKAGKVRSSTSDGSTGVSAVEGHNTASGSVVETYGVRGISDADGDFNSATPAGVQGTATGAGENAGVLGVTESTKGRAAGVKAVAKNGSANAIIAKGNDAGVGVEATTGADGSYALWGRHTGASGTSSDHAILGNTYTEADGVAGVKGKASGTGGNETYGVCGTSASSAGYGVYSDGDSKTAGNHEVTGSVGINQSSPTNELHVTKDDNDGAGGNIDAYAVRIDHNVTTAECLALKSGDDPPNFNDDFISFFDSNNDRVGQISGDGSGGVNYRSYGSDYAEYLPLLDSDEELEAADVVGVVDGAVTRRTADAEQALVVSEQAIVTGNSPGFDPEDREGYETIAFIGQVPVKVRGPIEEGDLIVPSGEHDGTGRAMAPAAFRPGDGPIVGRAWESDSSEGVSEVTVAVGLEAGDALEAAMARQGARLDDLETENAQLRDALNAKADHIEDLTDEVDQVRAENDRLRDRLAAVEDYLGLETTADPAPADD
jgi:uncharacterized coiled-coil protein SlyX